jgi:dTDP-glucose 4,6-dehydratase
VETASTIADGTGHLLRLVEGSERLRNFLHFSSGLLNGIGEPGASSVYADSKRFGEALCAAYRSQSRVPVVITRPFTFIGPFQPLDAPWAANNFLHAALHGQPLKLLGSGEVARSYLYGSDMAVLALMQLTGGQSGEVYDLGGTQPLSLIHLAELVAAKADRRLEIRVNTAGRDVGGARLVPDMTKSVRDFGFRPAFETEETIARTLEWHRSQPAPASAS